MCAINRSIAILTLLVLTALVVPATAVRANGGFSEVYDHAVRFVEQGAYAEARETLHVALAAKSPAPSASEAEKAKNLLGWVDAALENLYLAQETARERSQAESRERAERLEGRRAERGRILAEADRLFKLAEQGKHRNYRRAGMLYVRVASDRAVEAFEQAADYFEQGEFDKAKAVFERLHTWVEMQKASDLLPRPEIGAERERRLAEYLGRIESAKRNRLEAIKAMQSRARREHTPVLSARIRPASALKSNR